MYYKRVISDKIRSLAAQFPAVILTGARQTGKTTLLRHLFPSYRFVSLDLPSAAEEAEQNPEAFFQHHPPPVVIDEAQYAPGLFRHLKVAIDRERKQKGRFIITGSQKFVLMKDVSESLAGRCGMAELDTFSSAEILITNPQAIDIKSRADIVRLLVRGTFPELWEDETLDATEFYRAYLATYLERDVRSLVRVGSLRDFERCTRLCATRSGQLLNKSELARDVGVSAPTISEWVSVLEASNQILLLEPYFTNIGKRLIKTPKLYFHDTGLLCFLLGLTENTLVGPSPLTGSVWKTCVINQIRRDLLFRSTRASLWFWRDQYGNEIDCVIDNGGKLRPIEIKWTASPSSGERKRFLEATAPLGSKALRPWIATTLSIPLSFAEGLTLINPILPHQWDALD